MGTNPQLDCYRALESLYREMLVAARIEEWEQVGELSERAAAVTTRLQQLNAQRVALPAAGQERDAEAAVIEQVLALSRELEALAVPAKADRASALAAGQVRAKLNNAYGL